MKILFSAGELDKELNANTKIVLQLAEYMAQQGHTVAVSGMCYYKPCDETANGVLLKKFAAPMPTVKASEAFEDFIAKGDRNALRAQFIKRHPLKSAFLALRYNAAYIEKVEQPAYLKHLKDFANDFKPDVMVLPYKPINSFEKVIFSDIAVPMVAYQMDPWGLHRLDNPKGDVAVVEKECAAFERAAKIFTTPVLLHQYAENSLYKKYTDKMIAVDFPNVKSRSEKCCGETEICSKEKAAVKSAIEFDGEYINILFCGVVADGFRSPEYALNALAPLFRNGEKIRVYFMGVNNSAVLNSFVERYPQNVFFKDKVSADAALATMEKADVLFNISNKIDNQVPSKIFDYFATGKPVLNLQQLENCPAAEYFEKYPLVYTLKQWEKADDISMEAFLKDVKGRRVDFDTVKEIYKNATVEYVAESMLTEFEKLYK